MSIYTFIHRHRPPPSLSQQPGGPKPDQHCRKRSNQEWQIHIPLCAGKGKSPSHERVALRRWVNRKYRRDGGSGPLSGRLDDGTLSSGNSNIATDPCLQVLGLSRSTTSCGHSNCLRPINPCLLSQSAGVLFWSLPELVLTNGAPLVDWARRSWIVPLVLYVHPYCYQTSHIVSLFGRSVIPARLKGETTQAQAQSFA